ncbi:progesterone-induced-blocking factor 1-like [Saccoglossus kowalevskii]|uniref:Progesterone-induced-blocking factor 1-like n=1 Tax=Saccoglossus kowalevskii TaxID=10224 RepID=A0ABM0GV11_SACKO|nr:PREDICTED: progesterone-induced-blocking factor 1-like [Saccoglossus kowalevskii]
MARRDLSMTFSEMSSDDISTSLVTDDISADESEFDRKKRSKVTKQLIERKQLLHDLQLLKIELSQKNLTIDNLNAESSSKIDELEEKLADAIREKQLLRAKLESQLKLHDEDARRRQQHLQGEIEAIMKRQHQLEKTNAELQRKAGDIRRSIKDIDLSEDEYYELKNKKDDQMTLKEYVALTYHDTVNPLKFQIEDLKAKNKVLEQDMNQYRDDYQNTKQDYEQERKIRSDLEVRCQRLTLELADTKSQIQQDDYRRENYSRVKSERDDLEHDFLDVQKQYNYTDAAYKAVTKERDDLLKDLASIKQTVTLLQQDKEYLTRQVTELNTRYHHTDERLQQTFTQLDNAKRSREEMYDKYVEARDQFKAEYEKKLRDELDSIRLRTDGEIDRLKASTKEMYERENRNLREARDNAVSERDRALSAERDTNTKYESLLAQYRQVQVEADNKTADLRNETKLKTFEAERTQMVHEETVKTLRQCQLENDKYQKKIEVLTQEYYGLQNTTQKRITELDTENTEMKTKLTTYEKLEQELDDVVMQAADIEDESEAERVLFSYGYGANVPTTAKRRLKQSVHLARRVLQLERMNTSLRKDIENGKKKLNQISEELSNANNLLDQAQQPYNYLIESIRMRDSQVQQHKKHIEALEEDMERMSAERADLVKSKNLMSADLERLLNQREEMSVMKQVVLNLSSRRHGDKLSHHVEAPSSKYSLHIPEHDYDDEPSPTIFTNQDPPKWYRKLKDRSASERSKYSTVYASAR